MRVNPTEAETALSELYNTRRAQFTETPLAEARARAFERFATAGLPHRRVEAYRYTDLRTRLRQLPPMAAAVEEAELTGLLVAHPPVMDGAARIVIANGRYDEPASTAPAHVTVRSILDPEADTSTVGALVADSDDPLTLANVGLFDGGAVVHVAGEAGAPLEILHVATGDNLVMGRVAVTVAEGARLSVIERMIGQAGTVDNSLTELTIAPGAHVDWVRLAEGASDAAVNLSSLHVRLGEGAQLEHLTVTTGKGLSRSQVFAHVAGDDAEANFRAATVALGKRHADNTFVVRHDALGSRSSEVFRSAVGAGGTAIIQGRIVVDPGAQKTDARMMSNALFLDDTGEVVNKPELEIFADDVQCGHGATSGDLDEEAVFYLRARGIPEIIARRLLVEAFVLQALDRVSDDTLSALLADHLRAALAEMGGRTWT
ncbi:SufD family Fe-S cluster assembly protein [Acuticoccus sp.]|uniref:SufB/SufD family protein n=1 Tax=Acuticoccus sp. TaxID=1904378 RepID=UPI003B51C8EA